MATKKEEVPEASLAARTLTPSSRPPKQGGCVAFLLLLIFTAVISMFSGAYWSRPLFGLLGMAPLHTPADTAAQETNAPRFWTCSMHPQVVQDHPGQCPICHMELVPLAAEIANDAAHPNALMIDAAVIQNMGVRTAKVRRGPISRDIRATGYLNEAQPKVHEVNLRVSGWIETLYTDYDGIYVHAGDPLFELYSPEIHQAAGELINATKATGGHMAALGDAARRKLELWGLGKGQIESIARLDAAPRVVTFFSPVAGHLLNKSVVEGTGVMAGQKLFNIVDHSQLWMDISIFERDLPFVEVGTPVSVVAEAHTASALTGLVYFIHPHVDMKTRAATARLVLENPDMTYRPGMYATAHILRKLNDSALLIPREAIIDTGARQIVFLALDGGHFELREVTVGAEDSDGDVEIVEGLEEHQLVVTSGQFLLDNESRLKEAVRKFLKRPLEETKTAPPAQAHESRLPAYPDTTRKETPQTDTGLVFQQYLALAESLGKQETDAPEIDAEPLLEAAEELLAKDLSGNTKESADRLLLATEALLKASPEKRRDAFKPLSSAAISLANVAPPPKSEFPALFEVYCSMADASWLQRTEEVSNPFFAGMKSCGEVKSELPAMESAP